MLFKEIVDGRTLRWTPRRQQWTLSDHNSSSEPKGVMMLMLVTSFFCMALYIILVFVLYKSLYIILVFVYYREPSSWY